MLDLCGNAADVGDHRRQPERQALVDRDRGRIEQAGVHVDVDDRPHVGHRAGVADDEQVLADAQRLGAGEQRVDVGR